MSWTAGHLGQQQWGELKTWLAAEAEQYCDVLAQQETHWKESSEFRVRLFGPAPRTKQAA